MKKIVATIRLDDGIKVVLEQKDEGAQLTITRDGAIMYVSLDWMETRQLVSNLQVILSAAGESE